MTSRAASDCAGPGPDESITLYHHTSPEAALSIMHERRMISAAPVDLPYAFFSTRLDGNASGYLHYGTAAVQVRVPISITQVDESFHDGEQYMKIRLEDLEPSHFLRMHIPGERPPQALSQQDLATRLSVDNEELGPSLPGYHWHSVVQARGWDQPRLDSGNGGHPSDFCTPREHTYESSSHGVTRSRMELPPNTPTGGLAPER